jgi:hypothetical protein
MMLRGVADELALQVQRGAGRSVGETLEREGLAG